MRLSWREEVTRTAASMAETQRKRFILFIILQVTSLTFLSLWGESTDGGPLMVMLSKVTIPVRKARLLSVRWFSGGIERVSDVVDQGAKLAQIRSRMLELEGELLELRLSEERQGVAQPEISDATTIKPKVIRSLVVGTSDRDLQWLILDKGSLDGVKVYDGVITSDGVLGRVDRVLPRASRVLLAVDRNSAIGVRVKDPSNGEFFEGIVRGMPDGRHLVLEVKSANSLPAGASVLTSPYSTIFPPGLPVGKVVESAGGRGRIHDRYIVNPLAEPFGADQVLILTNLATSDAMQLGLTDPLLR